MTDQAAADAAPVAGGVAGRTFASLRHRNFRLFFFGQMVSSTGNWLTNLALTLLVLHLTGSGVAVGLLTAAQYGPTLVLSFAGGAVADRIEKLRALYATQVLAMAQSVVLAVLAFRPHPPLLPLYATAFAGGVLLSLDNPLRRSFVAEMVPSEDQANAAVLYSIIINGARVVGPTLAGLLVTTVGFGWCFTVDAASYLFVLLAFRMMRPDELFRRERAPRQPRQVRDGFRYVATTPTLRVTFVMLAVIGTLAYNFNVTLPLLVKQSLGGSDATFTSLYAVWSVGAVLSALVIAGRRLVELRHVITGAIAMGLAMLLLAATPDLVVAVPVAFVVGVTSILYMTSSTALVQVQADRALHGRVLALQMVLLVGTAPIGGPLLGALSDALGPRVPIALGALSCFAAAGYGVIARD